MSTRDFRGGSALPRTISDLKVPDRSPSELWPVVTSWLGRNSFTILTPQSNGRQQVISHWDGALLIRPRPGTCVALREMTGGGTIVFEIGISQLGDGVTVHTEGYVTARGPGWKGKEYDLIPKALAVGGILRKRGLLLMEGLQQTLLSRVAVPLVNSGPLASSIGLSDTRPPPQAVCGHCGQPLSPGARFCPTCGSPNTPTSSYAPPPLTGSSRAQMSLMPPTQVPSVTLDGLAAPPMPLLSGETLVGRFASSVDGQKRVASFNMYVALAIVVAVIVPFFAVSILTKPATLVLLIFLYPPILIVGMLLYARYSIGRKGSTTVFVTNRRIIVDQRGKELSTSMALENVGHVDVNVDAWAARHAGVAWVYVLPMGTPKALVGGGRSRHVAPGVLWVPAVPLDSANSLRNLVVSSAREVQIQLGYPAASLAQ